VPGEHSGPDRAALGRAVRSIRHQRNWTLEVLAQHARLHWTYVGGIERGERNPSWENVVKLARALDIRVSELAAEAERLAR
jgi:transcriptional regulator with XRE-family HTH domain